MVQAFTSRRKQSHCWAESERKTKLMDSVEIFSFLMFYNQQQHAVCSTVCVQQCAQQCVQQCAAVCVQQCVCSTVCAALCVQQCVQQCVCAAVCAQPCAAANALALVLILTAELRHPQRQRNEPFCRSRAVTFYRPIKAASLIIHSVHA